MGKKLFDVVQSMLDLKKENTLKKILKMKFKELISKSVKNTGETDYIISIKDFNKIMGRKR